MLGGRAAKRIAKLEQELDRVRFAAQEMAKHAYLVGITREGRSNKFLFARNGQMFEVETMGLLSDDIQQWRKDLLE